MQDLFPAILLVEDDAEDRRVIAQAFSDMDQAASIRIFSSSESFLRYLQLLPEDRLPALIVLDFNMPIKNGGQLLRFLKAAPATRSLPVVLYGKGMQPIMEEMLLADGAEACYEKGSRSDLYKLARSFRDLSMGKKNPADASAHQKLA
ncbi:MAG TPA: response regulator [Chitinophagaceae bacterium]|nr:response regulator [Chitinophagaceae bacterium]